MTQQPQISWKRVAFKVGIGMLLLLGIGRNQRARVSLTLALQESPG
ncbi:MULTISPECIES: hypothetical protein [unclassified Coleofasciculus]|nr:MULTISPECIES: hypothetical protein [unclassified Coleofasciculus]MBD1840863.1 hypothetical protein [Coleofasciculus sp. FACHB-501]